MLYLPCVNYKRLLSFLITNIFINLYCFKINDLFLAQCLVCDSSLSNGVGKKSSFPHT